MRTIVATNFEILGAEQVRIWNTLSRLLRERGYFLLLLTTNGSSALEAANMEVPYNLESFAALKLEATQPPGDAESLLALEERWVGPVQRELALEGMAKCRCFYSRLFETLEPDAVLLWNTLLPHSKIARRVGCTFDLPVHTIERGLLPGTWLCDARNNVLGSELDQSWTLSRAQKLHVTRDSLVDDYRRWYAATRPAKYPGQGDSEPPVVGDFTLILGQVSAAFALTHGNAPTPYCAAPDDISSVISAVVAASPGRVAFRDHPINLLTGQSPEMPRGVLRLQSKTLAEWLERASAVVSPGFTSALWEALVLEKPLLVVGGAPLSWLDPYYTVKDDGVAAGLDRMRSGGFGAIRRGADHALSFLLSEYLIGVRPDVPAAHSLGDLADFVCRYRRRRQRPLELRLAELQRLASAV